MRIPVSSSGPPNAIDVLARVAVAREPGTWYPEIRIPGPFIVGLGWIQAMRQSTVTARAAVPGYGSECRC